MAARFPLSLVTLLVALSLDPPARAGESAEFPIRQVVVFTSGVSFFEHRGVVDGDQSVELRFNIKDINDLLKSMVVQDLDGGRIATVSYDSKDPITRTLKTFSVDLTDNPTLANLLGQLRGQRIELETSAPVAGMILGVESRARVGAGGESTHVDVLNLLTDDGLLSVPLDTVGKIRLLDGALDDELRRALALIATTHSQDKKAVTLKLTGQGERTVRVGYLQESPAWKTSYRLVVHPDQPPLLQGWAIVENTTEADWEDVALTLISGRPISFTMELYEPHYVSRPQVAIRQLSSVTPQVHDQNVQVRAAEDAAKAALTTERSRFGYGVNLNAAHFVAPMPGTALNWEVGQSVQSAARGADVGELFQYAIGSPISIRRGRSAMIPIVNDRVTGKKLSLFNPSVHARYPLNVYRLKNTTALHLMPGPVTVLDGNIYAGDGQIQSLPPDGERLISYAMDLKTEVSQQAKSRPAELVSCQVLKGVLHTKRKLVRTQHYTIVNSDAEPRELLIEQPIDAAWKLKQPDSPTEKTRDTYRFAVTVEPGKPVELSVVEERTQAETVRLMQLDATTVQIYLSAASVSDQLKQAIRHVRQAQSQHTALVQERQEFERKITVISDEQQRIRENMAQLPRDSELYRRYVRKFTEQEDRIDTLRDQVTSKLAEEVRQAKELERFLAELNVV